MMAVAPADNFLLPGMVADEDDVKRRSWLLRCNTSVGSDLSLQCAEDFSPIQSPLHPSSLTFENLLACAEAEAAKREAEHAASATSDSEASDAESPTDALIIFDWDDTLCPTTSGGTASAAELHAHAQAAEQVLRAAARLGSVEIVTMAGKGWVEETTRKYMPGLKAVLEELQVPVTLSRVGVPMWRMREAGADERDPSHYLKHWSMRRVVANFRRGAPHARSVISVGDSEAERLALQDVLLRQPCGGLLGKVVKLKKDPTVAELSSQLLEVAEALPWIAEHDADLDLDFDGEFDAEAYTSE